MTEILSWIGIALAAVVPTLAVIGFWMRLASRITLAESTARAAKEEAESAAKAAKEEVERLAGAIKEANDKIAILQAAFALYSEQIAREYIHREMMREVEDRLTAAIERLGDRLDRVLERSGHLSAK